MSQIIHLGRLSDKKWPGSVSAEDVYVDIPSVTSVLDSYYVVVHEKAKTRCIDGRHDPSLDETKLGPQVPGGAIGAALAYRLGVDKDDLTRGTFYSDAEAMIDMYMRLGLAPGGHRDDREHDEGVGCGAIDGVDEILDQMIDARLIEDHKRLVRMVLDMDFDRDRYLRVLGAGTVLESHAREYFLGRDEVFDLLELKSPGSVSVLQGAHHEKLLIVNFVPGTTLASNRFANDHSGMQAFGYDIWRSKQLARMLLPLDSQDEDRARFVTARVMITIATLMALTDGSQQVLLRLP
ncbi:MAG TPA: hypothetical protein PKV96_03815 [Candidatus Saccharimonas sp.]|jgi:hypothetical protein|nr:hypothetical protein [Candidatus Saccharimonas sp.]